VVGTSLLAVAIGVRLVELQILRAERLRALARRQHEQIVEIGGQRGAILDRRGRELAASVESRSLFAHPWRVRDPERAAAVLAPLLGLARERLLERLRSEAPFVFLGRRLDPPTAEAVEKSGLPVGPGEPFGFEREPKRVYPQGRLASHVVGWANIDQKGLEGIERSWDERLAGDARAYLAVRDGRGGMLLQLVRPAAKEPEDVVLTIDLVLQHLVERELDRAMVETGAEAASAILLDPATGQVLALANRPAADPNRLGETSADARRNRAITDLFEPGSTFKVITAAAALERGTVTPETRFDCGNGSLRLAGRTIRDVHPYGVLSVAEILERSSNVGIVKVGRTLPREVLREKIVAFGFGRRTGIELPGERAGLVTAVSDMSLQSPASMAMGYEVAVTALQIASAFAAIANDGLLVPPRIVLGVRDARGRFEASQAPAPRRVVSSRTARELARMLEGVVVRGTGKSAAIPGYRIAGKTGTARKNIPGRGYAQDRFVASFAGFGPASRPRLAGLVVLDSPSRGEYYGGLVSAPVFGRIMADALFYLGVPPDEDPWQAREQAMEASRKGAVKRSGADPEREADGSARFEPVRTRDGEMPDLRGLALRPAIGRLAELGCRAAVAGSGLVAEQNPEPGSPVSPGTTCALTLAPAGPDLASPHGSEDIAKGNATRRAGPGPGLAREPSSKRNGRGGRG
jgi:cell division protein FtsI (penicillin-binding protein 3)